MGSHRTQQSKFELTRQGVYVFVSVSVTRVDDKPEFKRFAVQLKMRCIFRVKYHNAIVHLMKGRALLKR